jgi:hypothetical protein
MDEKFVSRREFRNIIGKLIVESYISQAKIVSLECALIKTLDEGKHLDELYGMFIPDWLELAKADLKDWGFTREEVELALIHATSPERSRAKRAEL